jgi:hypothetical protein
MTRAIFVFLNLISMFVFAQENPWTPKGENPWAAYENKSKNQTAVDSANVEIDSSEIKVTIVEVNFEIDSSQIKETSEQKLSAIEYDMLLEDLEDDVVKRYKNKSNFGAGFAIGIILGIPGIIGDGIYAATNSKREKKIVEEVLRDSTYQAIPDKALKKETKKTMKNKKFAKAVAGTIVAVLIRAGIFTILIMS